MNGHNPWGRGPYILDGHYMYGNTMMEHRPIPYYNSTRWHKKPGLRDSEASAYGITRSSLLSNFVDIETSIEKILNVTIYGINESMDVTVQMHVGNRYAITYVTESGLKTAIGYLKVISDGIPDECMRYIGKYNAVATAAYIGLDCSAEGLSDKRMIYIATIRGITELGEGEAYVEPETDDSDLSDTQKLLKILGILAEIRSFERNDAEDEYAEQIMAKLSEMDDVLGAIKTNTDNTLIALDGIIDKLANIGDVLTRVETNTELSNDNEETIKSMLEYIKNQQTIIQEAVDNQAQVTEEFKTSMIESLDNMQADLTTIDQKSDGVQDAVDAIADLKEYISNSSFSFVDIG